MQLAFSTLGCPEWSMDIIVATAQQMGYDGIEYRGLLGDIELPCSAEFSPPQIGTTRRKHELAHLRIVCLSSSVQVVASTVTDEECRQAVTQVKAYIDLAHEVDAPFVRVFCGPIPLSLTRDAALYAASCTLRDLGEYAHARRVTVVVETHDAFTHSEELLDLIRRVNHPAIQVLWDIHHPYRLAGESISYTMGILDGHVRYTHVKDSLLNTENDSFTYVPLGDGDVPVREAIRALDFQGYDGFLTLEWEKRWVPALAPPEIIFPHYITQMRGWLATR